MDNSLYSNNRFKVVIIGPENSGKSALLNAIFGKNISKVSEVGGTTKKPVKKIWGKLKYGKSKKEPKIKNISFVDLGGLFTGEKESPIMVGKTLELTYKEMKEADLIIHVVDGEKGLLKSFEKIHHLFKYRYQKPIIGVINKCDLLEHNKRNYLKENVEKRLNSDCVFTSTITYEGITDLINNIMNFLKK
ncbi:50S ribosome-binding GTPase [Methanothermococcus sp. SCGC AD-155-M21]|nr:50S ribosome-binding GTPase [Methanothermococcus sp. SCGC AD-155-M21]